MTTMASRIREHLRTRYCTPQQHGAQIPPERELMKRYAVSRPTVRNAVADLVADGYLKRFPGRGTFVVDPARKALDPIASPVVRHATVALIARNMLYRESANWLSAAMDELYNRAAAAMTNHTAGDPFREIALLQQAARRHVEGIIVHSNLFAIPSPTVGEQVKTLRLGAAIPTVVLGNNQLIPEATSVWLDEIEAGYVATKHLIDCGHRRIAHIAWPGSQRDRGYHLAMQEAGLPVPDDYVIDIASVPHSSKTIDMGRNAGKILLAHPQPPTAVFAYWSEVAGGVMLEALSRGMRVPRDLAVIGVDGDIEEPARSLIPMPISRVWIDMAAIGRLAVNELFKELTGAETHGRKVVHPPILEPGPSTVENTHRNQ